MYTPEKSPPVSACYRLFCFYFFFSLFSLPYYTFSVVDHVQCAVLFMGDGAFTAMISRRDQVTYFFVADAYCIESRNPVYLPKCGWIEQREWCNNENELDYVLIHTHIQSGGRQTSLIYIYIWKCKYAHTTSKGGRKKFDTMPDIFM